MRCCTPPTTFSLTRRLGYICYRMAALCDHDPRVKTILSTTFLLTFIGVSISLSLSAKAVFGTSDSFSEATK